MRFIFASPLFIVSVGVTVGFSRAHETIEADAHFQQPAFDRNRNGRERELLTYTEEDRPVFGTRDRIYEADVCPSPCEVDEFCGIDSSCHRASCENVYKFGLQAYTNNDPEESEALKCVDFTGEERDRSFFEREDIECSGLNELPSAVSFECDARSSCPRGPENGPSVTMNRKCTAKTTRQRFFSCYDIAPQTDLDAYFADYIAETEVLQAETTTCADAEIPRHNYGERLYYTFWTPGTIFTTLYGNGLPVEEPGNEFNLTLASMAMIARSGLLSESHADPEWFPRCADDEGCGYDEFCGIDETCHFRNCENFYDFGPTQFTGNKTKASQDLTCYVDDFPDDITPPCIDVDGTFPTLVHFTCQPTNGYASIGSTLCIGHEDKDDFSFHGGARTKDRFAVANRVCKAEPNVQQEFLCYDIAPETNLTAYFQDYVDSVSVDPGCDQLSTEVSEFSSFGNQTWAADYHDVESCFGRPGFTACTYGYWSMTFNPEVMMPPAMHTVVTGQFLAQQEEEEEEDSAFLDGGTMFWIAVSMLLLTCY